MKYKIDYITSEYAKLPDEIKDLINKDDYARCFVSDDSYIIELLIRNNSIYSELQLDYDMKKKRFLTREEREVKIPEDRVLVFEKYSVKIFIQYSLEEKTDFVKEMLQIYFLGVLQDGFNSPRDFFSFKKNFEYEAKQIYEREEKEKWYQSATDYEKSIYWTSKIFFWMRQIGEQGEYSMQEIRFFNLKEMEFLKKEEPNIEIFMPRILTELAQMWMTDMDNFFAIVNKQLGTSYVKLEHKEYPILHINEPYFTMED